MFYFTRNASCVALHTSHVTRHTSHVSCHTSHVSHLRGYLSKHPWFRVVSGVLSCADPKKRRSIVFSVYAVNRKK